ncbi:NAD(P)-dependent dehydrogenase, short-chain alcohol dehydrogenase family [Chitinophaga sp. YR627]|uniref:short chain dehydrogenase n=1 Tax=Chitinophaga sp. YR627 TaxID=1881041 RepID=UPI0008EB0800|nr:short chain dehydrogenase [Chitinophaga sp. YR627]SFO44996.1 NAD(P)-dependent dehydrogenase, short-chain alcohol dehydrogenase family [Chitinophaga sp. YR627]
MKIILIGASGTIGKHIASSLEKDHEIIRVGSKSGVLQADITSPASIEHLFKQTGPFDALVSTAGDAHFGPLKTMGDKEFRIGVNSKLMGQVNLVLIGQHYIKPKGSFTLISGVLSQDPVLSGANPAAMNGAIESFVRAAAIELENGVRINAVSPTVVEESPGYFPYFPGHIPVTMKEVVAAYHKSILGAGTGQVIKAY